MTAKTEVVFESGTEIDVPLSKLKKSPKNARKVAHTEAAIEALAASIGAKAITRRSPTNAPTTPSAGLCRVGGARALQRLAPVM